MRDRMILLLAVLMIGARTVQAAAPRQRPNVLFIFADDQCFETIRAFGHTDIDTPNLDRLVRRGTTFTHAYNMGSWSGAVCIASRCMLVTGRYLWHANRVYKTAEKERQAGRFWTEYMKQAGYDTYFTGKWHIRANPGKAFLVSRHVRPGMPNQTPAGYNRPLAGQPDAWSPFDPKFGGFWKGGTHWSVVVANDTIDYLHQATNSKNPFFMYIAFNAAHDPRQSPKAYVDKYPLKRIKVPVNFQPEYPFKDAMGCGKTLRDERLAPFPRTRHAVQVHRQEYYALITHMDAQIGRILAALKATGKADNTYIFFTADHGLAVGHHGLMGKQNLYDDSVRVPFIAIGPGIPAGRKIDSPIYLQDVMPTTLELAGVPKPKHVEFHSLLPLLRGQTNTSVYDAVYGAYLALQRSVTFEGYKLILYPKIKKVLLYNLRSDPREMHDLASRPESQPVIHRLFARLLKLQRETGDSLDLEAAYKNL